MLHVGFQTWSESTCTSGSRRPIEPTSPLKVKIKGQGRWGRFALYWTPF